MSNINPQNIDGTYPIAGQDNNSQGFRDNFTNTINNFTFAAAELNDLQQNAVLKAPLGSVGQTGTPTNDMNYAFLTHAQLIGTVETKDNIGSISSGSSFEVDWETGHFQTVSITTTAGMTFANWPSSTNVWSRLRLQVTATTLSNLTFSGTYIENLQNIQGANGNVLTLNTGVYQFDFSSLDAGAHVWIEDVLRNYDAAIDFSSLNVTGNVLATGLRVFGNTSVGLAGAVSGQFHSVVGNITQTTSGGAVYINTAGNVLAAGAVLNALTVNGTTTLAGSIATTGLQHFYPTANVAITGNIGVSRILVTPTSSPSPVSFFVDVTLPNVTTDGTVLSISSNVAVNELRTLSPWVGTTVSPSANVSLTAGSQAQYLYRSAESKWYKIA